jgi:hypothetical protein
MELIKKLFILRIDIQLNHYWIRFFGNHFMKKNLIFLIFELLDHSSIVIMSKQKLILIDELNQILEIVRQD